MAFDPEEDDPITDVEPLTPTGLLYFWGKLKTWAAATFAALSHNHAASDITSGTLGVSRGGTGQTTKAGIRNTLGLGNTTDALPIANGGTGSTSASDARTALGITPSNIGAAAASHTHAAGSDLTGQVPVANGGTGAATASGARTNLGAAAASHTHDASTDLTGQVPIANGGTGASTAAAALTALGAASQDDMDDAEQAIADNAAAIATLGESVYFYGGAAKIEASLYGIDGSTGIQITLVNSNGKKFRLDVNNNALYYIIENADGTRVSRRSGAWTGQ